MLRRVAILGLCLGLIGPAWSDSAPPAAPASELLTPEDSRALILRALSADRHDIAGKLALGLLRADPEDPFGHMVMSTVLMRAGNLEEARRAAKLAYRHADTRRRRHEAARVVAATEARDERFVLGQLWMRRALQAAPTAPTGRSTNTAPCAAPPGSSSRSRARSRHPRTSTMARPTGST